MNTLSLPVKALFIDEPFVDEASLRAMRSRFIWRVLSSATDADLLLLKSDKHREQPVPRHDGYDRLYSLSLDSSHQLLPSGYHQLAKGQGKRFAGILDGKRYQLIVMASLRCLPLAYLAGKTLPHSVIVIDLERLYLPELKQQWQSRQDIDKLPRLWDFLRQSVLDRFLLRGKIKYFVSDPGLAKDLKPHSPLSEQDYLPLPLPFEEPETSSVPDSATLPAAKFILFWGDASRQPNLAAAKLIAGDIYPRISKKLVEKEISIVLCGDDAYQNYCGGRIIHAPAEHLDALLSEALFVLLPLSEPDSEARIFSCAQHRKALLCTDTALSSLPLPEGTHYSGSDPDSLAATINHLLRAPRELEKTGIGLHDHCQNTYSPETLTSTLLDTLKTWMAADAN